MFSIVPAAPADARAAAAVLAEAFEGDAVLAAVTGRAHADRHLLERYFLPLLRRTTLPMGGVDLARRHDDGAVLGAAVWVPPGAGRRRGQELLRLPALLAALGPAGLRAAARTSATIAAHRPAAPHWYLVQIGVAARARGHGVGTALLRSRLARVDAEGAAAHLEATTEANRRLYLRHGFDDASAIDGVPGVRPTAMWRAPRPVALR